MDASDSRTRKKVSLGSAAAVSQSNWTRIVDLLIPNFFLILSFWMTSEWLLSQGIPKSWVIMRSLAFSALGHLTIGLWRGDTAGIVSSFKSPMLSSLILLSLSLAARHAFLLVALGSVAPTRVIAFSLFSSMRARSFTAPMRISELLAVLLGLALSLASDTNYSVDNIRAFLPGHLALAFHLPLACFTRYYDSQLSPRLGVQLASAMGSLGAFGVVLISCVVQEALVSYPPLPAIPLSSLLAIPLLGYSIRPFLFNNLALHNPTLLTYVMYCAYTIGACYLVGTIWFTQKHIVLDIFIACLFLYAGRLIRTRTSGGIAEAPLYVVVKSNLTTIMDNAESRKIFYFLVMNISFMVVQMLYGVWTNSLGLISDAIHMGFDCMAIAVGLFASIMATWPPNERFTYGYGRIETLSGFANGIFLVLISMFIVFEAVQRLLDPPEMSTNQLLLISTLGLCVNLFGMFATGGHHHHHHHHHHGPGHDGHGHDDGHLHSHLHTHTHAPDIVPSLSHSSHQSDAHIHGQHEHTHEHWDSHSGILNRDAAHNHLQGHMEPLQVAHWSHHPSSISRHTQPPQMQLEQESYQQEYESLASQLPQSSRVIPSFEHQESLSSPVTPSYRFGIDAHFAARNSAHTPNFHDHSHIRDHHGHHSHSDNMRGVFLHIMADTLGSVGVIISTLLIQFYGWTGFDPIASLFIALLIAGSVIPLIIDTGRILALDVATKNDAIESALFELDTVLNFASYASPQFWPKDSDCMIGSIHLRTGKSLGIDAVVERVDTLLRDRIPGLEELTIQVDAADCFET